MADALSDFYYHLRKLQDQDEITSRQLLGLFFDLYEFMRESRSEAAEAFMEMFSGPGGPRPGDKMIKLSPEEFDEVVKRDKEGANDKKATGGKGQYL